MLKTCFPATSLSKVAILFSPVIHRNEELNMNMANLTYEVSSSDPSDDPSVAKVDMKLEV